MQRIIPLLFPTNWLKANPDYTDYLPIPKELVSLDVMGKQANASVEWAQNQAAKSLILAQRILGVMACSNWKCWSWIDVSVS